MVCSTEGILPCEAHSGSMTVSEPQGVWLALGEQVRGAQALHPPPPPPPPQRSDGLEGENAPLTEAHLKSLCCEPLVELLYTRRPAALRHMIGEYYRTVAFCFSPEMTAAC